MVSWIIGDDSSSSRGFKSSEVITASPSGLWRGLICGRSACGWCSQSAAGCPVISPGTHGSMFCHRQGIYLWPQGKITLCADVMWITVVISLVFTVVSGVVGVSISVIIMDTMGCLGLEGIYDSCSYFCSKCSKWVIFLYLPVWEQCEIKPCDFATAHLVLVVPSLH